mmetsp:Transcript_323/g.735  ORF Transcript_323/g.735 Transcript_323/m.735 type:complete len:207 (-) Transcript_323:392-1012(-)
MYRLLTMMRAQCAKDEKGAMPTASIVQVRLRQTQAPPRMCGSSTKSALGRWWMKWNLFMPTTRPTILQSRTVMMTMMMIRMVRRNASTNTSAVDLLIDAAAVMTAAKTRMKKVNKSGTFRRCRPSHHHLSALKNVPASVARQAEPQRKSAMTVMNKAARTRHESDRLFRTREEAEPRNDDDKVKIGTLKTGTSVRLLLPIQTTKSM